MNLSKIAVGVAVSLCLVSNMVSADMSDHENDTKYNLSLENYLKRKFNEHYNNNNLNSFIKENEKIIDEIYHEYNSWPRPSFSLINHRIDDINNIINKLTIEQRENLLEGYSYTNAIKLLNELSKAKDERGNGLYYIFKSISDIQNENNKLNNDNLLKIEGNIKNINENAKSIIKNKESIKENSNLINLNSKTLLAIKSEVEKLTINTNDNINNLKEKLDNLNKTLKNGLATQAALNGLFQPYSIGKMNITAALGGYKSYTALALGAGYRFNQNIAAKTGISSSLNGSDLSYTVGVNYEF